MQECQLKAKEWQENEAVSEVIMGAFLARAGGL
jgi:hypothetical protein